MEQDRPFRSRTWRAINGVRITWGHIGQYMPPLADRAAISYNYCMRQPIDRFIAKVDQSGGAGACWPWQGTCNPWGYGRFYMPGGQVQAHRFAFEWAHRRTITDGMEIDHLCNTRNCVNPEHLEEVTPQDNTLRSNGYTAMKARQTHCIHGHEFSEENTRIRPGNGHRQCRTCERVRVRVRQAGL